jgi:hypothetical protein
MWSVHDAGNSSSGHAGGGEDSNASGDAAERPGNASGGSPHTNSNSSPSSDCIVLAPCAAHELLPMNPEFPADTFTSCLTTPIPIALRWFIQQNMSMAGVVSATVSACI